MNQASFVVHVVACTHPGSTLAARLLHQLAPDETTLCSLPSPPLSSPHRHRPVLLVPREVSGHSHLSAIPDSPQK